MPVDICVDTVYEESCGLSSDELLHNWELLEAIRVEVCALSGGSPVTGVCLREYDAGDDCMVKATGTGITFSKSGGTGTMTIPEGVILVSATIRGETSDLSSNNFKIKLAAHSSAVSNAGYTTLLAANINVINTSSVDYAGPSDSQPFIYDQDNDPQKQIVDVGSTDITFRIINLNVYTKWAIAIST